MLYKGENVYPGRAERRRGRAAPAANVAGKTLRICVALVSACLMLTALGISYSRLISREQAIKTSAGYNMRLYESVEYYTSEIERMTSPGVISQRARELGLVESGSVHNIIIPGRG